MNAEMPTRANNMTERELAYIAGIIDGEGSISIERRSTQRKYPTYSVTVTIVNTNVRLISWLYDRIGGCLINKSVNPDRNHKAQFQIQLRHLGAEALLNSVREYLIVKGEQADVALALRKLFVGRGGKHTDGSRAAMEHLYLTARRLNKRGKDTGIGAERLSEEGPLAKTEHAIVRSHGNNNRENVVEIATSKRVG